MASGEEWKELVNQERLRSAARGAVEHVLDPNTAYNHGLVASWTADINRGVLDALRSDARPHERCVVHCTLLQKSPAPFYTATAAYWNDATDLCVSYRWTNATIVCIVTVISVSP